MIPKVIYITHKNIEIIRPYSQKWIDLNPEYTIELYDNERCIEFLTREYTQQHVDIFNFISDGPIKADFWRVCILYKYGGIYADADIVPLVPLCEYIKPDIEFATCISKYNNQNNYNPHFIMSLKDNPRLKRCIEWYTIYYNCSYTVELPLQVIPNYSWLVSLLDLFKIVSFPIQQYL